MKEILWTDIKFIYEYSNERASFSDLEVGIVENKLITSLFMETTDQY